MKGEFIGNKEIIQVQNVVARMPSGEQIFFPLAIVRGESPGPTLAIVEKGQVLGEIRDWAEKILEVIKSPVRAVNLGTITAQSTFVGSTLFGLGRFEE